jgi:hypothetical protein
MKWIIVSSAFAWASVAGSVELSFTVELPSSAETSGLLIPFQAPKAWAGVHQVNAAEGAVRGTLQVREDGQAMLQTSSTASVAKLHFTSSSTGEASPTQMLKWSEAGDLLHLTITNDQGTEPVLSYQMAAGKVPDGVPPVFSHGAHLHPVFSPGGKLLTHNHPADHYWHRGIWLAWTKTRFQDGSPDFWNMGKTFAKGAEVGALLAEVRFHALRDRWEGPVQAGFIAEHHFIDRSSGVEKQVLHETWQVTVSSVHGAHPFHVLDLVSTQRCAGADALQLPEYHYGGLGVRGNALWAAVDDVRMLTSEGHDRKSGDATRARWVTLGGDVDGVSTGMVILIHPGNFRFPQPLRLNPKHPQLSVAPSQLGQWSIQPGTDYTSRYRFILADREAAAEWIEPLWKAYAQPPKVTLDQP